ncbi:MAG: DUF4445 domain-containing protein [Clostridia bacterium]|nr:MAG: DUF4445 domain-containing protein [Clostridia bacterium]
MPQQYSVLFLPDNVTVQVEAGESIFRAASRAGIELKSTCGNKGTCGRCAIKIKEGKVRTQEGNIGARLRRTGHVLACQTLVAGDVVVEVPKDSRLDEHQVLLAGRADQGELVEKELDLLEGYAFEPVGQKVYVELPPPTLTGNATDLNRLEIELRKKVPAGHFHIGLNNLRRLAEVVRAGDWKVSATLAHMDGLTEIVDLKPGSSSTQAYGLAIDIGTTTVVVYLVDLNTGATVDQRGGYNKQARYGDDVISRIIRATENGGLNELHTAVITTINELVEKLVQRNKIDRADISVVVVAANTTMTHMFLGLPPKYIRLEPYIPTASEFPPVKAGELNLAINPDAWVLCFPAVASYMGGDIVAGVLATRLAESDALTLFIDIGTNGEMVLGNRDWMISCSCSAGPAFEGGGITFGMRAMKGAIERATIDPQTYEVEVQAISGYRPIGICGSGLIDLLAKLRRAGLIDRTGQFTRDTVTPRLRQTDEDTEFVLVWGSETECGKDIVITESDIKNILRSKGAVFAGIQSLLKAVQLDVHDIDRLLIAGGFGNYLNIHDAIQIGLLPDLPVEKYAFVGNTSVKGAKLALLSRPALEAAQELARKMTYLELSAGSSFMDEFVSALFLPHTDLSLFPSVKN